MKLFNINQCFDTTGKPKNYKKSCKLMSIWMLVVIGLSMVAIWGPICTIYLSSSSISISVGIESYIYNGWKVLASLKKGPEHYAMFAALIVVFAVALAITYFTGIKAFVKGLKNLSNDEVPEIFPYFILIAFTNFVYFSLGSILANGAFSANDFMGGWGYGMAGFIFFPSIIGTILFSVINSYDKEKIPEFVGRLFMAASIFILIGIVSSVSEGFFTDPNAECSMLYPFGIALSTKYSGNSSIIGAFMFQGILEVIIYFLCLYTIFQTTIVVCTKDLVNKKSLLIAPVCIFILIAVAIFSNGVTQELIKLPQQVIVNNNVIGSFVCSVILVSINLINYFVVQKQQ